MTAEQPPPTEPTASSDATDEVPASAPATPTPDATAESTTPPVPAAAPAQTKGRGVVTLGVGQIIAALGAIAVGVACLLDWLAAGDGVIAVKAQDIPLDFLWSDTNFFAGSSSILASLIPIAFVIAIAALIPQVRLVGLLGGIAALVVAGLYAYQLNGLLDGKNVGTLTDRLGVGAYFVAGGGVLAIIGSLVPRPSSA